MVVKVTFEGNTFVNPQRTPLSLAGTLPTNGHTSYLDTSNSSFIRREGRGSWNRLLEDPCDGVLL